jgi:hypothetical protein
VTRRSRQSRWAQQRPASDYNTTEAEAAEVLNISTRRLAALRRSGRRPNHVRWRHKIWYSLEYLVHFYKGTRPKIDCDG